MMAQKRPSMAPSRDHALEFFLRILDRTTPDARQEALDFLRDVLDRYDRLQKDEGEDPSSNFRNPSDVQIYSADDDFDNDDDYEDEYEYDEEDEYDD